MYLHDNVPPALAQSLQKNLALGKVVCMAICFAPTFSASLGRLLKVVPGRTVHGAPCFRLFTV
jgi:hypothetical protein